MMVLINVKKNCDVILYVNKQVKMSEVEVSFDLGMKRFVVTVLQNRNKYKSWTCLINKVQLLTFFFCNHHIS